MIYAVFGFLFGLFIPVIARGYQIYQRSGLMFLFKKKIKKSDKRRKALRHKFLLSMSMNALLCMALSYGVFFKFGVENIIWNLGFVWVLLILMEIDFRMQWLPDVFVIPLLLFGFLYAVMGSEFVSVGESAIGAILGYFLPFLASLFFIWKKENVIGGGDIKLLAAVGAWLGMRIPYVIVISAVIFIIGALIARKKSGAFGPAIVISALAVAFCF